VKPWTWSGRAKLAAVALAAAVGVAGCGGGGGSEEPAITPKREATATPTATRTATPEALGGASEAVEPVLASEGGRPDCPEGWYVYTDPDGHFSICYPSDWSARAAPPQIRDSGWSVHIHSPVAEAAKTGPSVGSGGLTVGWRAGSPIVVGCAGAPIEGGSEETLQVAEHEAVACHFEMPWDVPAPELAPSSKSDRVEMDIPLNGGGYLWVIQTRSVESIDLSRITLVEPLSTLRLDTAQ
jgi:hypothetical protein